MIKKIIFLGIVGMFLIPLLGEGQGKDFVSNDLRTEVSIDKEGKVVINGAKIFQFAGGTMYTRLIWGNSFVRLIVKTNSKTEIVRKFGEPITVKDMKVGDYIYITGELESGSDSLAINANLIKNISDTNEQNAMSGKVVSLATTTEAFSMEAGSRGTILVKVSPETSITLGSRKVDFGHIKTGDRILSVNGVYNHTSKIMDAKAVTVFIDMNIFKPRNFEGVLKSVTSTSLPAVLVVRAEGKDYKVKLGEKSLVWNKAKKSALLSRFLVGDSVRFYGYIEESDEPVITAEIIRNLSL